MGGARINSQDLHVSIDGLDDVVAHITSTLLAEDWTNNSGSIIINPNDGRVFVDLAKMFGGPNGLNGRDPNTEVFSEQFVQAVLTGIADTVSGVTQKIETLLSDALEALSLTISADITVQGHLPYNRFFGSPNWQDVVGGGLTISGSISDFAGLSGTNPAVDFSFTLPGPFQIIADIFEGVVNTASGAVSGLLTSAVGPIVKAALGLVTTNLTPAVQTIVSTVFTPLNPIFEAIYKNIISLRVNEQPTKPHLNCDGGDLGDGSFTVRALSLTILPGNNSGHAAGGVAKIAFASSTVKCASEDDLAEDVLITSPVDGAELTEGDVTVSGTGEPGASITVELTDEDGTVVGPKTTTVGTDGTWSVTFEDVEPGDYTARAEQAAGDAPHIQFSADVVDFTVVEDAVDNANASASAAASANADDNSNASAQAAAQAAGNADASSQTSAAADASAQAAAQAAANADASTTASGDVSTDANAAAQAAAAASADSQADSAANADASAAANANASAASSAADTDASATASANAAADAQGTAQTEGDTSTEGDSKADDKGASQGDADTKGGGDAQGNGDGTLPETGVSGVTISLIGAALLLAMGAAALVVRRQVGQE